MSYATEVANLLTAQLDRFVTLNRHQLAGQVANLDFWMAEAEHALAVIDGYDKRFDCLDRAQRQYVQRHEAIEFDTARPRGTVRRAAPPSRVPVDELREGRQSLCDSACRF